MNKTNTPEVIQIMNYGISLLNVGITINLLPIFVNIQSERELLIEERERELTFIYGESTLKGDKNIWIQTFGSFAIFVDDQLLTFKRQKAKELLACLVDRQGADITTKMACALLWEDKSYDRKMTSNFRNILSDLRETLRAAGVKELLIKKRNSLAIDITKFDCDSYRFLKGDPIAVNAYQGNYLNDYSWAELMNAHFNEKNK